MQQVNRTIMTQAAYLAHVNSFLGTKKSRIHILRNPHHQRTALSAFYFLVLGFHNPKNPISNSPTT